MTTTSTTTTMIPSTTRPIPTFTQIPITSRSTAKSTPVVTSSIATTPQVTIPRTTYATDPFVKGSKILILNNRNVHKSMTISEKNNFQNANITFELGTQAYKACSVWFRFLGRKLLDKHAKIVREKSKPEKSHLQKWILSFWWTNRGPTSEQTSIMLSEKTIRSTFWLSIWCMWNIHWLWGKFQKGIFGSHQNVFTYIFLFPIWKQKRILFFSALEKAHGMHVRGNVRSSFFIGIEFSDSMVQSFKSYRIQLSSTIDQD